MPAAGHKKIDETAAFPYVPRMNISDQISAHWAAHQEESGRVWTLLPNQRQPQTAAHLQQKILSSLLVQHHIQETSGNHVSGSSLLGVAKAGFFHFIWFYGIFAESGGGTAVWGRRPFCFHLPKLSVICSILAKGII